jgi:hypothetical protein
VGSKPDFLQRMRDVLVYAPVGAAKLFNEELNRAIEIGKATVDSQVSSARAIGEFAIKFGQNEVEKRLGAVVGGLRNLLSPRISDDSQELSNESVDESLLNGHVQDYDGPSAGTLSIPEYDALAASQVIQRLESLSKEELEDIRLYEQGHRNRRTILAKIDQLASDQTH